MTIAHSTAESQAFLEEGGRILYEAWAAERWRGRGRTGEGRGPGFSWASQAGHCDEPWAKNCVRVLPQFLSLISMA